MKITTKQAQRLRKEITLGIWLARNRLPFILLMSGYRKRVAFRAYERARFWVAYHEVRAS